MGKIIRNDIEYGGGGGGGTGDVADVYVNGQSVLDSNKIAQITNYVELTQAEYDALPASKLTDNILYCIKDQATADTTVAPIIYSEEEREVGVWTDGKPLYQKTILIDNISSSTGIQRFAHGISNVETVISTNGTWLNKSDSTTYIGTKDIVRPDSPTDNIGTWADATNIVISTEVDRSDKKLYITFQYTKTTDTPGSGKYAPSGVPAVHYSENEQVVGTWIDGSTIYEKTLAITSEFSSDMTVQHGITNIGEWIKLDGIVRTGTHTAVPINDPVSAIGVSGYNLRTADLSSSSLSIHIDAQRLSQVVGIYITLRYTKSS